MLRILLSLGTALLAARTARADPLACQPNEEQPMLPTFHIIGNVTKNADGSIKLEAINDCSGVTYSNGIYHVWHQCCQNHWDHVISRDLIHWQRLPVPIQPVTLKTWDGSISMLDNADPLGPVMIYDAQDGREHDLAYHSGNLSMPLDRPILGIARLDDPKDKYLMKWSRAEFNPVKFTQGPSAGIAFPGPIWKQGDHWNFIGQGSLFSSATNKFDTWTRKDGADGTKVMAPLGGGGENSGQWMMPVPKQVDGSAPPSGAGAPNILINTKGGDRYVFATWDNATETLTPWTAPHGAPPTGQVAELEKGGASWWGASGGTDNNGRMMMIGWATPDYHHRHNAGLGVQSITRLTMLREVNYEAKTQSLVSNPVPELTGLRTASLASEKAVSLMPGGTHLVAGTENGKAASADVVLTFSGWASATSPVTVGACVLGSSVNHSTGIGISITINPAAGAVGRTATITSGECAQSGTGVSTTATKNVTVSRMMNDTNFPHGDLAGKDHQFPAGTQPTACQALCDSTPTCEAWTFLKRGPQNQMACCIKGPIAADGCPSPAKGMVSGAKVAGSVECTAGGGHRPPPRPAKPTPLFDETELTVRILPDRSLADFFVQGGRWAGTEAWVGDPRAPGDSQVSVFASATGLKADIDVWGMGCGWLTPSYTEHPTI